MFLRELRQWHWQWNVEKERVLNTDLREFSVPLLLECGAQEWDPAVTVLLEKQVYKVGNYFSLLSGRALYPAM